MTLSMDTMIIVQQVYVHTFVGMCVCVLCIFMYMTVRMCLCQLASIHIGQCLSIKLLSDFGQSDNYQQPGKKIPNGQ